MLPAPAKTSGRGTRRQGGAASIGSGDLFPLRIPQDGDEFADV
jgi:hypothetical protein